MTIKKAVLGAMLACVILAGLALAPLSLPGRTTIVNTVFIARPPDAVFDYVTTPANWPRWHPASLAVSGTTDHSLVPGESVTEDFMVAGRKGRVLWTVLKRAAPHEWIIEGDVEGRKAGAITYTLAPAPDGTRFERIFVYGSPNLLFALLNQLSIRKQVEAESALAVQNLKRVLETRPRP